MRLIGRTGNTAFQRGKQYYNDGDYPNAWRKFLEAAEYYHHAMAQHYLGIMSESIHQNNSEALTWYLKSADQENSISYSCIGLLYRHGINGVTKDYQKAIQWFENSMDPLSLINLGHMYRLGEGVVKNPLKALDYYKHAATKDATEVYSIIGNMYRDGEKGIKINYNEAELWYKKGLSDPSAMIGLASLSDTYNTESPNFEHAFELYKKAAYCGNSKAQYCVAWYYQKGLSVKRDYRVAYEMYQKSARNGYAEAYAAIGTLHHAGLINGSPSYKDAFDMYTRCIEIDPSNSGLAFNGLGLLYQDGLGVFQCYTKSKSYFSSAVKIGHTSAYNSMGEVFKYGYGVNVDYTQAKYWFTKSAFGKNDEGQLNLGLLYLDGLLPEGVDYENALLWFRKALRRGNERAQDYIDQTVHSMAILLRSNDKDVIKKMEQDMAILTAQLEEMKHHKKEDENKMVVININLDPSHTLESVKNDKPHEKSKEDSKQALPKFLFVQDMREVNHKKKVEVITKLRMSVASTRISYEDEENIKNSNNVGLSKEDT